MNLKKVFSNFCEELQKRTEFTSEDTIRYYWYISMLKNDPNLNNYILEAPYGTLKNKELDLLYSDVTTPEYLAFEIKFHRKNKPSTFAHTDAAGAMFGDILRLQHVSFSSKNGRRFFLYVTDSEMDKYLRNTSNLYRKMLNDFYVMSPSHKLSLPSISHTDLPKTFLQNAYASLTTKPTIFNVTTIQLLEKWDNSSMSSSSFLGKECHVRLYEIVD